MFTISFSSDFGNSIPYSKLAYPPINPISHEKNPLFLFSKILKLNRVARGGKKKERGHHEKGTGEKRAPAQRKQGR